MSSLGAAVAAGPSRLLPRSPVSVPLGIDTDTFPVAVAVRNLHQSENIAVAAVYLVFAVFLILRLLFPRKAVAFHRRAAYSLFVMACAARIPQFILNALGAHNSGDGHYPDWRMVFANDLLSTVGWAFWLGAVFALGYSWSGRIPCVYCMVQFSDEPHWTKGLAIYVLPCLFTAMTVVATVLRLIAALHPWSGGYANGARMDPALFGRASFLALASVSAALAFSCCFIIVVPFTAVQRRRYRVLSRGSGIDPQHVAAMVQSGSFNAMSGYEPGAVFGLIAIGVCTVLEGVYRLMLVKTAWNLRPSTSWFRGQLAMDLLEVLPEWIALLMVTLLDFEAMTNGTVELRWYWQDVGPKPRRDSEDGSSETGDTGENNPNVLSEASFWTSRPAISPNNFASSAHLPMSASPPGEIPLKHMSTPLHLTTPLRLSAQLHMAKPYESQPQFIRYSQPLYEETEQPRQYTYNEFVPQQTVQLAHQERVRQQYPPQPYPHQRSPLRQSPQPQQQYPQRQSAQTELSQPQRVQTPARSVQFESPPPVPDTPMTTDTFGHVLSAHPYNQHASETEGYHHDSEDLYHAK